MTDDFETRIRELYETAFHVWGSKEFHNYPQKEKDHLMVVIYLNNAYDQLHSLEQEGPNCQINLHPNPITAIARGIFPNYGNLGISSAEAGELLDNLYLFS
jgi:hypothetical protein